MQWSVTGRAGTRDMLGSRGSLGTPRARVESLGGLPAPSMRWKAGRTVVPWASLTLEPHSHRLGPHRLRETSERSGQMLTAANSWLGVLQLVSLTHPTRGPHRRENPARATCVALAKTRSSGGSSARRGCHSRRPSTTATTAVAAAPPRPARVPLVPGRPRTPRAPDHPAPSRAAWGRGS